MPNDPPYVPDAYVSAYKFFSAKLGIAHPSLAVVSGDLESCQLAANFQASAAVGDGFKVVYAQGSLPQTVSDYTPYVQRWLTSAGGGQPNVIVCLEAAQCIPIFTALQAGGFKGDFYDTLGDVQVLAKSLAGTFSSTFYNPEPSAAYTQMVDDINALKPGTALTPYSVLPAYLAADMFVSAVQRVEKQGKALNPTEIQIALDHQTWQDGALAGPLEYPQSAVSPTRSCAALVQYAVDGSGARRQSPIRAPTERSRLTRRSADGPWIHRRAGARASERELRWHSSSLGSDRDRPVRRNRRSDRAQRRR